MESRVNYTLVGLFVVTFSALLVAFAFWLGKYNNDQRQYQKYKVYITESVSGLSPEAAVKFHGVNVGIVESIQINPNNSEEVELILKIKKETPIKTDSRAMLKFFGITGLAFIEISGGAKNAPLLAPSKDTIAIIPTAPSLITRLDESLSNIAFRLSQTLKNIDTLLNADNVENVSQTLSNLRLLTEQINAYQGEIKSILVKTNDLETSTIKTIDKLGTTADSITNTSNNFNTLTRGKLSAMIDSLEKTSKESQQLIQKLEATLQRGDYNVATTATPAIKELETLITQSQSLTQELETTLQTLRSSPSDLIFKQSYPKPGPGE